ncbi:hypothetical protein GF389_00165 [Candidatus Dojkabacteria bacterium]|nr:hypothetical protein [Candidatus Dojkabacteria bacterium]
MQRQKNTEQIRFMATPVFKKRLKEEASKVGVGISTYLKHTLLEKWDRMPVYYASPNLNKSLRETKNEKPLGSTDGKTTKEFLAEMVD